MNTIKRLRTLLNTVLNEHLIDHFTKPNVLKLSLAITIVISIALITLLSWTVLPAFELLYFPESTQSGVDNETYNQAKKWFKNYIDYLPDASEADRKRAWDAFMELAKQKNNDE